MCRWYAAVPQNIDGAIARWRKASGLARLNSLIMRPANAAKRRSVALPPGRGATAQDGSPDDDQLQVRKAAAFACGLWSGSRARRILRASSAQCKATLEGAVGEIMTLIIRIGTPLFRIAQGGPQSCDPPSRNDLEGRCVHVFPPLDRRSRTMQRNGSVPSLRSIVAGLYRPRSTAERAYHAFNAAVTVWHICDWIWETASEQVKDKFRSISPESEKGGVRLLQALVTAECCELAICRELATGAKHFVVDKYPGPAGYSERMPGVDLIYHEETGAVHALQVEDMTFVRDGARLYADFGLFRIVCEYWLGFFERYEIG